MRDCNNTSWNYLVIMLALVLSCVAAYVFAPVMIVSAHQVYKKERYNNMVCLGKEERLQQIDNIVHSYDMGDVGRLRAIHTALVHHWDCREKHNKGREQ